MTYVLGAFRCARRCGLCNGLWRAAASTYFRTRARHFDLLTAVQLESANTSDTSPTSRPRSTSHPRSSWPNPPGSQNRQKAPPSRISLPPHTQPLHMHTSLHTTHAPSDMFPSDMFPSDMFPSDMCPSDMCPSNACTPSHESGVGCAPSTPTSPQEGAHSPSSSSQKESSLRN
eukprot:CAMPEP_0181256778 /NCGR_PEP_ID=MMETSP1096-20121128/49892_1 /TAXON_ID=156174 ORGANISM="Chrysochromulina ericina, Strain CCMP281" /NCGR_SAMPLE_ID=MMETSP1096 /ASSEMBLY_ACC=CAM_ASM_000453 /LENGTH=172 /DNA_ID=CAMNT_0023355051 /DNA_START=402 /DNA_END=917 /DNA_ORIENTATION=+